MKTYRKLRSESTLKREAIIWDVDGTLADKGERDPFDFSRVGEDLPIKPVVSIAQKLQLFYTTLIVSGRHEESRLQTDIWLRSHGIWYDELFMRGFGDNRHDWEVKRDIYIEQIKPKYPNIIGVFDDRLSVIDQWLKMGVFVFNCNNGRGAF